MQKATQEQWEQATEEIPVHLWPLRNDEEVFLVLDAVENDKDPLDHLEEHRYWRSPVGRAQELQELRDTGHPLGDKYYER